MSRLPKTGCGYCLQLSRKPMKQTNKLLVLCSNDSSRAYHTLAHQHPGRLGWLIGPTSWKTPRPHLPYALDNDAYIHFRRGTSFDLEAWLRMIEKATKQAHKPMWALVPDVVADKDRTLALWSQHWAKVADAGF